MIEVISDFPDYIVAFVCRGDVTRDEYESVVEPVVAAALEKHEKIRLYYEIGEDFEGVSPGAFWEDVKIGVEHLNRWERIAVVTDIDWIRRTMSFFGFLMPGEIRFFSISDTASARKWLSSGIEVST